MGMSELLGGELFWRLTIEGLDLEMNCNKNTGGLTLPCTMQASTNLCKIPGPYGFKYPTLQELHKHLFEVGFDGAHDAMVDVLACAKCFFELERMGSI